MIFATKIFNLAIELVFPKICVGCGSEEEWLCSACSASLAVKPCFECPICRRQNQDGSVCDVCRSQSRLDGLWIVAEYETGAIAKVIKGVKYQFIRELTGFYEPICRQYFKDIDLIGAVLVPVPLHRRRELWRGFNQAELIASMLARIYGLQCNNDLLKRVKYAGAQAKLDAATRRDNVKDAFQCSDDVCLAKNSRIVLVDDVYTTGATMQECARVLRHAGFENIWGLVLARGE